jgi:hypothetical protein
MKALEKERRRRYETASALALDIRRFLDDEPVHARPPSLGYRVGKFVRRNRGAVAAAAAVVVALVGGTAFAVHGMWRAQDAERRAAADARSAEEVSAFLIDLFHVVDPAKRAADLTVRELLDQGALHMDRLAGSPRRRTSSA